MSNYKFVMLYMKLFMFLKVLYNAMTCNEIFAHSGFYICPEYALQAINVQGAGHH